MKNRRIIALALLVLLAAPAVYAYDTQYRGAVAVKGHTVFIELIDVQHIKFAAVAVISKEQFVRNSILWFNDQEAVSSVVDERCFEGYVWVTPAGEPPAQSSMAYVETYIYTDPNDIQWRNDVYEPGPTFVTDTLPGCGLIEPTLQEVDEDRVNDFDEGCQGNGLIARNCYYNGLVLVNITAFGGGQANHPTSTANDTDTGDSHEQCEGNCTGPVAPHWHSTANVNVFFQTSRPPLPAPSDEKIVINDFIGSTEAFDEHPCTMSAEEFTGGPC